MRRLLFTLVATATLLTAPVAMGGTLFIGADVEDFQFAPGVTTCPTPGCDRLGKADVTGAVHNSTTVIPLDFLINGMADAGGVLLAGTPSANALNTVDFNGNLLGSVAAPGIPNASCCNEEMLFVPQAGGPDKVYHAHFADAIREIDPVTGVQIGALFPQIDVVGMALVNGEIWISKWNGRRVGIWDPSTNIFTEQSQFNANLAGLGNTGALAFDPSNQILWVGSQGGLVTPFDLAGNILGPGFQPFGPIGQTIDGLTFLGEVTSVPEPGALVLLALGLIGLTGVRRR